MRQSLFLHGLLGGLFVAGLCIAIWQSASPGKRSLTALRVNAIALTLLVTIKDVLGDVVYTAYRENVPDSARSLILASSKPWAHEILMEFKEHAAHVLPAMLLVVVAIVFVYDIRDRENLTARKVAVSILAVSLVLTLVILFMGAMATSVAGVK